MHWQIQEHEIVDSTNALALAALRAGASEGTVITALAQTAGRGRLAREWWSPPGKNVYLSAILRPDCMPEALGPFALVVGLGVLTGLDELAAGLRARIKWPNDIYVGDRKLAGILVESVLTDRRVDGVVAGIGLNVNGLAEDFPADLQTTATSLRQATGRDWPLATVRDAVLQGVANSYRHWQRHGFASLRPVYEVRSYLDGRRVCVTSAGETLHGVVRGITLDGALQVVDPQDRVHTIVEGDLETA